MREITASVTERGQVTIPAEVRKALGIQPKSKVSFVIEGGVVVLKKPKYTIESAAGSIPALKRPMSWKVMRDAIDEERAAEYVKKIEHGDA